MMIAVAPFGAIGGRCGLARPDHRLTTGTGCVMRAVRGPIRPDRMSVCVMLVAGLLCGVSVFVVALPLAFSSPFPPPPQREWIIQASTRERTSSFEIARPAWAPEPVGAQADLGLAVPASFAARWDLTTALAEEAPKTVPAKPVRVAALAVPSEPLGPTGAIEAARPKPIEVPAVAIPPKKRD